MSSNRPHDNLGTGALWSNEHWQQGGKAPKWTGYFTADRDIRQGEKIPLAAWPAEQRQERSPKLRMKVARYKEQREQPAQQASSGETDFDDDLPF